MPKIATPVRSFVLAAALVAVGAGPSLAANSIAVPDGASGQCAPVTNPNAARFEGSCGARVTFDGSSNSSYVQDNTPAADASYIVRLYVNLRRLVMGNNEFDLFSAYDDTDATDPVPPATDGTPAFRLAVQESAGAKSLVVYAAGGGPSAPIPLQDGWRSIEVEWAAGSPGHLNLWIDGWPCDGTSHNIAPNPGPEACNGLTGLANSATRVDYARWGAVDGVEAYSGTLCPVAGQGCVDLDDFASQRSGSPGLAGIIGPAIPFTDYPQSHQFSQFVQGLYQAGITSGCGLGIFCPDNNVPRDQMAVFVTRGLHGSAFVPPPATGTVYNDVPQNYPDFASWIEQLRADGIADANECGTNLFCPNALMLRRVMAKWLLLGKHGPSYVPPPATGTVFADVAAGDVNAAFIEELKLEGITSGCGLNGQNQLIFCPGDPVNRGQMAVFVDRTFGKIIPKRSVP